MILKTLIGSGDKIGSLMAPFLVAGLALNIWMPSLFSIGGPPIALRVVSAIVLALGIAVWAWSAALILAKVPRKELITQGPYAVVKHPLYTGVALLVLPWIGFLLNSWLGILIGAILYVGSRIFSPAEEVSLAESFGPAWEAYRRKVMIPWL